MSKRCVVSGDPELKGVSSVKLLREHRERAFARGHAKPEDFVFASQTGGAMHYRNVARRGLDPAAERAKLIPTADERKAAKARGEDGRTGLRWLWPVAGSPDCDPDRFLPSRRRARPTVRC